MQRMVSQMERPSELCSLSPAWGPGLFVLRLPSSPGCKSSLGSSVYWVPHGDRAEGQVGNFQEKVPSPGQLKEFQIPGVFRKHLRKGPWDQKNVGNAAYFIPFLQLHVGLKPLKRSAGANLVSFV